MRMLRHMRCDKCRRKARWFIRLVEIGWEVTLTWYKLPPEEYWIMVCDRHIGPELIRLTQFYGEPL